jgi:hypothetical protein
LEKLAFSKYCFAKFADFANFANFANISGKMMP